MIDLRIHLNKNTLHRYLRIQRQHNCNCFNFSLEREDGNLLMRASKNQLPFQVSLTTTTMYDNLDSTDASTSSLIVKRLGGHQLFFEGLKLIGGPICHVTRVCNFGGGELERVHGILVLFCISFGLGVVMTRLVNFSV